MQVPVAYFTLSMTMRHDTPANQQTVMGYLSSVRNAAPLVTPVASGIFAGRMRYRTLPLSARVLFWLRVRLPSGDFRDWAAVRAWAADLRPRLMG